MPKMKGGFFVSCKKGKEKKAFLELQTILNSFISNSELQKDYCTFNVAEEIEDELKNLRTSYFSIHFTYKSLLYVSNSSTFLSSKLFRMLKERHVLLEYVHRIFPLDHYFTYNAEYIKKLISNIDKSLTFKIEYKETFAVKNSKKEVFKTITGTLQGMKVDLKNPHYLILVQVLKNDLGITILENFTDSFNFSRNLN